MQRRRPRSENLELFSDPVVREVNKERRASDARQPKDEEETIRRRRPEPQHPTSAEFEQEGRVEPKR